MAEISMKRHNMAFITEVGKKYIWEDLQNKHSGVSRDMLDELLNGTVDIPGFIRRAEVDKDCIPLGLVHPLREEESRQRFAAKVPQSEISSIVTPYEVIKCKILPRNACIEGVFAVSEIAKEYNLSIGVLGSAAMEIITGLSYTDTFSDLDFVVQPAEISVLEKFYQKAKSIVNEIELDVEVDFPNGYGVKLGEFFMDTRTVLGKSLNDVQILEKDVLFSYMNSPA